MDTQQGPPPQAILFQFAIALFQSRTVQVFAELCIADDIAAGRKPAVDDRILKGAASLGLVRSTATGYELTPVGEALRSDVPGSMRAFIAAVSGGAHYAAWGNLAYSAKTGQCALLHTFPVENVWDYYTKVNPEEGRLFNQAMAGFSAAIGQEIVHHYDLPQDGTWIDVGGGVGMLLATILNARPNLRGIVTDLPFTQDDARKFIAEQGMEGRLATQGADFFQAVPGGGDYYSLKHILHDRNDKDAAAILRVVHAAMPAHAKLFIIEAVIPEDDSAGPARMMDLNMLVMCGGKERTAAEWRELLDSTGFRLGNITPLPSPVAVIEVSKK